MAKIMADTVAIRTPSIKKGGGGQWWVVDASHEWLWQVVDGGQVLLRISDISVSCCIVIKYQDLTTFTYI